MIPLSKNEYETLRILWNRGELKPAEIQGLFSWEIENATLRSTLVNLVEKGHITRKRDRKAYYYSARVHKATLLRALANGMARIFSGGSIGELVAQLVETGDIKPADIRVIREMARSTPPKGPRRLP